MGVLKPLSDKEMSLFTEAVWMVALFWLNYLEVGGETVNDATLGRGIDLLRQIIAPHLTKQALAELGAGQGQLRTVED
jgi:hypothetical protein